MNLKIKPKYFNRVLTGDKRAEVRSNLDRDFTGVTSITLEEFDAVGYTGRKIDCHVTDICDLSEVGVSGFTLLSIRPTYYHDGKKTFSLQ